MTTHGSKGLEFDHVYIPYAQEKVWSGKGRAGLFKLPESVYIQQQEASNKLQEGDDPDDEESRRLFFVALTRARKHLTILYSQHDSAGEKILPAAYIADIDEKLKKLQAIPATSTDSSLLEARSPSLVPSRTRFLDFVHGSFYRYGLSVSALNNYLEDPWKYFYVNLVRIPQGKSETLMYGNAIHNALSYFFSHYKESGEKSLDYLLNAFEMSAKKEHFSTDELERALERGREHLRTYYLAYEDAIPRNVRVKQRIKVTLPRNVIPANAGISKDIDSGSGSGMTEQEIPLNGELDLIEYLDVTGKRLQVRDWKTGKARSRNEIVGDTKDGDGGYYRQLVFYKLLLKLQHPDLKMESGMIDFVQADDKGKLHQEIFEIPNEEVEELEKTISRVTDEILSLSFWDRPCALDSDWYPFWMSLQNKEFEEGLF
jgi:DNA helicase-2/ATP-dependent DNA helicase PcrA